MRHESRIVASVLGADYAHLGRELSELEQAGVDAIQWDIMDGVFVSDITFGPDVVKACRPIVDLPFEAHLMVEHPERLVGRFVEAGCETVIVHAETIGDVGVTVERMRTVGARLGVALNPETPVAAVSDDLDELAVLMLMTVEPGRGGQQYLSAVEAKIAEARRLLDEQANGILLEVDGGINPHSIGRARRAGADVFVVGSWILGHTHGKGAAVEELRAAVAEVG
jgi:ribulose-phosphate 3-epimerase